MRNTYILFSFLFLTTSSVIGQCFETNPGSNVWVQADGVTPCRNVITTVVPFLRIVPDARSSGMGNVGLATSADANALWVNPSKMSSSKDNGGISLSVVPWLQNLGLRDIYLAYLSGYYKFDELQAIGGSIRYFSIGNFEFTDIAGNPIGTGKPNEFELSLAYSRKLSDNLYAGVTGKYIYSNLATGQVLEGNEIISGTAFGADLAILYNTPLKTNTKSDLGIGVAITNIGSNISYKKNDLAKDHLPANLGIGANWNVHFDDYNRISLGIDINKLLVPTPQLDTSVIDVNRDGVADYRQKSLFNSIFQSFGDAPGGFQEEMTEIMFGLGAEYWYNDVFAIRAGYQYENPKKGSQRFVTLGMGVKYSTLGLDLSYIIPTSNLHNALDNTLRFTLKFDFSMFKEDSE